MKLGDICEIFAGGDVPKGNFSKVKSLEYSIPIYANGEKNKGLQGYTDSARVLTPSVTVSARGTIGYSEIRHEPFFPAVRLIVITPKTDELDLRYLHYAVSRIDFKNTGVSIPQLTVPMIKEYTIPVVEIDEQRRIVAKLDTAFEKIDRSLKLTQKNIRHTQTLFENILTNSFDNLQTTRIEKLGDVYDVRDGTHDSPKYHQEGYPLVTSKNLKSGVLSMENVQYISETDYLKINERSKVDVGDVLMAMIGTIGNPIIIDLEPIFAIKNVALFKPQGGHNGRFLKYYLQSGRVIKKMDNDAKGATQRFVSLGYLRSFDFPVVSPEQESLTIEKLDKIALATQSLELEYNNKLTALSKLKQSMLTQAFSESDVK